jgi:hypothetical protein
MGRTITVQRGLLKRKAMNDERQQQEKIKHSINFFIETKGWRKQRYTTNEMLFVSPKS